jgi:molecular chaperone DnaK (HSP70)
VSTLSVDLGTSNTVAVLSAHGRPPRVVEVDGGPNMPSAIFAAQDGRLVVGREAERQARMDPARFEPNPKRRVDEGHPAARRAGRFGHGGVRDGTGEGRR